MRSPSGWILLAALAGAAPAAAGDVLVVFEHSDFRGASRRIEGEVRELRDIGFQDRISSFRVEGGAWEVCTDAGFRGRCQVFDGDIPDLTDVNLDGAVSSLRPAGEGGVRGERRYGVRGRAAARLSAAFRPDEVDRGSPPPRGPSSEGASRGRAVAGRTHCDATLGG